MKYNFDEVIDRSNNRSSKYDERLKKFGTEDVIPLWVADMDFPTLPQVSERLRKITEHGIYGYSDAKEPYFQALLGWYEKHFSWKIQKEWLIKTPGVVFALAAAVRAYTKPGEAVLLQQPVYYPFSEVIADNERVIVNSPLKLTDGHYEIDFYDFEQKIRDNHVKLFLLCSPHNPVGRVWKKWELEKIGEICIRYGVIVVSDEIHSDFTWGENKHLMFASLSDDFANISITCTAPSKTFNLAGLQVSNIFIPNETLRFKFKKAVDAAGYSQVNVMGLEACQAAYEYGEEWLTQLKEYLKDNIAFVREFIQTRLPKLTMIEPDGTYLLWIDFRAFGLTEAQRQDLIENKANLWLDSGAMFGPDGEGFERFNVACPRSVLKQAFEQLEAAVNGLDAK